MKAPVRDYLKIAGIIDAFLNGTCNLWDWNDFVGRRSFKDPYLQEIKYQCKAMSWRHPALVKGQYCNDDGKLLLQGIAEEVRSRAPQ